MSHWMTSGKNRLKAKEDRSFAHRARSRATFMGFKSKNRSRKQEKREVQQDHPRFYKRTASKFSAKCDGMDTSRSLIPSTQTPTQQCQTSAVHGHAQLLEEVLWQQGYLDHDRHKSLGRTKWKANGKTIPRLYPSEEYET